MVKVRCADCGYLGVRRCNDRALVSPDTEQRRTGEAPAPPDLETQSLMIDIPILETKPLCAMGAILLDEEFDDELGRSPPDALRQVSERNVAVLVTQKERQCGQFVKWMPALSPKEHLDMNVLERQREWQAKESRRQRKWQRKL